MFAWFCCNLLSSLRNLITILWRDRREAGAIKHVLPFLNKHYFHFSVIHFKKNFPSRMWEEWRPLRHATVSSWLPWFWLCHRVDRSQMDVHFTGTHRTGGTGDPWVTLVERLLCFYWTADSKPYPAQLPYSDNDVQGLTSIIQGACCPEAQGPVSAVITHRALCIMSGGREGKTGTPQRHCRHKQAWKVGNEW